MSLTPENQCPCLIVPWELAGVHMYLSHNSCPILFSMVSAVGWGDNTILVFHYTKTKMDDNGNG